MQRERNSVPAPDGDDSDARGEHKYDKDQTPRLRTSEHAVHREEGQYAAGADGTQQVSATSGPTNETDHPVKAPPDPLPPSPLAPDRMQPPIEPEK